MVMGWKLVRGEDRELTLRLPRWYVWPRARFVLWGATRKHDVQIGSAPDVARQEFLNRQARLRRTQTVAIARFRAALTPTLRDMEQSFAALARATEPMIGALRAYEETQRNWAKGVR